MGENVDYHSREIRLYLSGKTSKDFIILEGHEKWGEDEIRRIFDPTPTD